MQRSKIFLLSPTVTPDASDRSDDLFPLIETEEDAAFDSDVSEVQLVRCTLVMAAEMCQPCGRRGREAAHYCSHQHGPD